MEPKRRTCNVNEETSTVKKAANMWKCLQVWGDVSRFRTQLDACGFGHLVLGHQEIPNCNYPLLEVICSLFDPNDCSFHFNKDVQIHYGLLDILFITGLNIDGHAVTGVETEVNIIEELKSFVSEAVVSRLKADSKGTLQLSSLNELKKDELTSEDSLKLFCFQAIGAVISPNSSNNVSHMYIPLLKDAENIKNFAWGAAMLASFHNSIRAHLGSNQSQLHGPFLPFIVFLCEMIPKFAAMMGVNGFNATEFPLMKQWTQQLYQSSLDTRKGYTKEKYVEFFENLKWDDVFLHNYETQALTNVPDRVRQQIPIAAAIVPVLNFAEVGRNFPHINPERFDVLMEDATKFWKSITSKIPRLRRVKDRRGCKPEGGRKWNDIFSEEKAIWDDRTKFIMSK